MLGTFKTIYHCASAAVVDPGVTVCPALPEYETDADLQQETRRAAEARCSFVLQSAQMPCDAARLAIAADGKAVAGDYALKARSAR